MPTDPVAMPTARRHGGRLYLLLFTAMLHGLVVECLGYVMPDIDNFWHGVSSVVFFKQRLPLHILLFCEWRGWGGGERRGGEGRGGEGRKGDGRKGDGRRGRREEGA